MSENFAQLVDRALVWLRQPPVVTPEQYRAITCNRCGGCCDNLISQDTPEQVAAQAVDPSIDADRRRWLAGLEVAAPVAGGWRYRCRHFHRDADGLGLCDRYETRPDVCRLFPYGLTVRRWPECSWFVEVRDADGNLVEHVGGKP